jgi:hypothetical protein
VRSSHTKWPDDRCVLSAMFQIFIMRAVGRGCQTESGFENRLISPLMGRGSGCIPLSAFVPVLVVAFVPDVALWCPKQA